MPRALARMLVAGVACAALSCGCLAGCGGQGGETDASVTESSGDMTVTYSGSSVTVALVANATTGYEWSYRMSDEGILEETDDHYEEDEHPEGMVGVGGTQYFTFAAAGDGEVTVTFTYAQPWEGGSTGQSESRTFSVTDGVVR